MHEQMEAVYKKAAESPSFRATAAHHRRPLVIDPKGKCYISPGQAFWDGLSECFVSLVDVGYAQDMRAVFMDCLCVPVHPEPMPTSGCLPTSQARQVRALQERRTTSLHTLAAT